MKFSWVCLLLVAVSALATRAAQAVDIDYTLTGLTAWNGLSGQDAEFDPTPDRPFRLTFNLNDTGIPVPLSVTSDQVSFSGVSPTLAPPVLSIAGAPPNDLGPLPDFLLENPATRGNDLAEVGGGPLFHIFFDFTGPALFQYTNGQATFETGTFDLVGLLAIENVGIGTSTPLADVSLTARSVPVPEGASWLLAASATAGVAGAYGVRRGRLRPAPSTRE